MFQKITPVRAADAVVTQIEDLILNGVLSSGDRLPPERELASRLDVSRPVLRNALKCLEERGLITSHQGGGTFVCDLIGPIFSDPVVALVERHPQASQDYLEFRKDMEVLAAQYAAERATDTDRDQLQALLEQMHTAYTEQDEAKEAELDVRLHQTIGEATHNIILMHALRSCYRLLENGVLLNQHRLYYHPSAKGNILKQHDVLVTAILDRDTVQARKAAEDHIDYVRQALREVADLEARQAVSDLRPKYKPYSGTRQNPHAKST